MAKFPWSTLVNLAEEMLEGLGKWKDLAQGLTWFEILGFVKILHTNCYLFALTRSKGSQNERKRKLVSDEHR